MRGSWLVLVTVFSPTVELAGQTPDDPAVRVMGFGDFSYVATELDRQEGFHMGQMVGHVIADIDERLTFFGEVSVTGKDTGYSIEIERAQVQYDFADALRISAGRFHTPVGYWNTAFHHGSWLQTSVARPEMIKFGSDLSQPTSSALSPKVDCRPPRWGSAIASEWATGGLRTSRGPATSTTSPPGRPRSGRGPSRWSAWRSA